MTSPDSRTVGRRRIRRLSVVLASALLLYTIGGFLLVPLVIRHIVVPRVGTAMNDSTASVERVRFNPFTGTLVLRELRLKTALEADAVAGFELLSINLEVIPTLFRPGYRARDLVVDAPFARLEISEEGSINLLGLLPPADPERPAEEEDFPLPRVIVDDLRIKRFSLDVTDRSPDATFTFAVHDLSLDIARLDTDPAHRNAIRVAAALVDGAALTTDLSLHLDPLRTDGRITLTNLPLSRFQPYVAEATTAVVEGGRLSIELSVDLSLERDARRVRADIDRLNIEDAALHLDDAPLLSVQSAIITNAAADLESRSLTVSHVSIDAPAAHVRRLPDGALAVESALRGPATIAPHERSDSGERDAPLEELIDRVRPILDALARLGEAIAGDWELRVEETQLTRGAVTLRDEAVAPIAEIDLSDLTVRTGSIDNREGWEIEPQIAVRINGAAFEAQGRTNIIAREGRMTVRTESLNLSPLGGYLPIPHESLGPLTVDSGILSMECALSWNADAEEPTRIFANGTAQLEALHLTATATHAKADHVQTVGEAELLLRGPDHLEANLQGRLTLRGIDAETTIEDLGGRIAAALADGNIEGALHGSLSDDVIDSTGALSLQLDRANASLPWAIEHLSASEFELTGGEWDLGERAGRAESLRVAGGAFEGTYPLASEPITAPTETEPGDAQMEADDRFARLLPILLGPAREKDASDDRWRFDFGHVHVEGSRVTLRAPDADPALEAHADEITVSAALEPAADSLETMLRFEIQSRVETTARLSLSGVVDARRPDRTSEIDLSLSALPVKPYEALVGRHLGYLVERGRVTANLPLTVNDEQLTGTLTITLDGFHLGQRTGSPLAPSAPIRLGLDLLRDRNDLIAMSVPIRGNLLDPRFTVGGVIWQAFTNVIVQAATSPFRLLAGLFGGGERVDASRVTFIAGVDQPTDEAVRALDIVSRALRERPALSLRLTPRSIYEMDEPALREIILDEMITAQMRDSRRTTDGATNSRLWALRDLFGERFPDRMPEDPLLQPDRIPPEAELRAAMVTTIEVPAERFEALEEARLEMVRRSIIREGGIDEDRVRIATPDEAAEAPESTDDASSVLFTLE